MLACRCVDPLATIAAIPGGRGGRASRRRCHNEFDAVMSSDAVEIEITLVVRSPDPGRVVERLEAMTRLGAHELLCPASFVLHDHYFDLPAGELRASGFALRLRHGPDGWLLGLKGGTRRRGAVVERVEIEAGLEDPALAARMAAALASGGSRRRFGREQDSHARTRCAAAIAGIRVLGGCADPVTALCTSGWTLIQDRRTLRRTRDVMDPGASDRRIAQLAIDTVTYVVAGVALRHHEVEIEGVGSTSGSTLEEIGRALQAVDPMALHPWRMSKLRTGAALVLLAGNLGPAALANPTGDLLPSTYALLAAETRPA